MRRTVKVTRAALFTFALLLPAVSAHAVVLGLNTPGSWGIINEAIFQQYSEGPGGSGNIDSFIRIQGFGAQHGYNSDYRPVEFDEDTSPTFNHSLLLRDIPIVTNGGLYREFLLDINQNGQNILSLDSLRIALHTSGNLSGYATIFSSPLYDLDAGSDNWIELDYSLNAGSGSGDMLAYIPDSLFTGAANYVEGGDNYIYLYSSFGENSIADDGFEEWAYGVDGPIIPEPATVLLLGFGGLRLLKKPERRFMIQCVNRRAVNSFTAFVI